MRKDKEIFSKGMFIPQERLNFEEGEEVVVTVGELGPRTAPSSR